MTTQAPIIADDQIADLVSLADARELLPKRAGRPVHLATLYRWAGAGCRGVKLRTVQVGGTKCTSRAWIAEFINRLSAVPGEEIPVVRTSSTRRRDQQRAADVLAAAGIKGRESDRLAG